MRLQKSDLILNQIFLISGQIWGLGKIFGMKKRKSEEKMRVAILETIFSSAGHEVEFDRILVDELKRQGHTPVFFVPEKYPFKLDYKCEIEYLDGGEAVTYNTKNFLKKIFVALKREYRRRRWFSSAYEKIKNGDFDALIIPTATSRYARAILESGLRKTTIPVNMIVHGVNPSEFLRFRKAADSLKKVKNVRYKILSLRNDFIDLANVDEIPPSVVGPRDVLLPQMLTKHNPLRLGFFGQYRKDKKVEFFLEAFKNARFTIPVVFQMQCVASKNEDKKELDKIINKYEGVDGLELIKRPFFGNEWREAISNIDVMMVPAALGENSRYHWGGVFFNALGFFKPVLADERINPEIFDKYCIGETFNVNDLSKFTEQLEKFVNNFSINASKYEESLKKINEIYSPKNLVINLLKEVKK
ncbi:MAG: glycosyltransferase [Acidaminococcaceae bacterium]|nr:glycosyltransferase [Acidaminococcaceae bacterium]